MKEPLIKKQEQSVTVRKEKTFPIFHLMVVLLSVAVVGSVFFLTQYHPAPGAPLPQITLEQKMAHLQTGAPLPGQKTALVIPRWIMALILGFLVIQILPLLVASKKARAAELTRREVRQIEFLAETPLFLGLLGSLLGVCMTQFISGTLAAPLAYLTSISGILLYLFGRFTILVSLPSTSDLSQE
ncbi:MAG: hypothetical protein V2A70_02285 [Candidatus Omnitrophota bacterium]